jgi:hypothetical protein
LAEIVVVVVEPLGTRVRISYEKNNIVLTKTGTIVAYTPNKNQLVIMYDKDRKMLFPPPSSSNITIRKIQTFPRPQQELVSLRQQRLRYRAAAAFAFAAHPATPKRGAAQDDPGTGDPASVPNTHNDQHLEKVTVSVLY